MPSRLFTVDCLLFQVPVVLQTREWMRDVHEMKLLEAGWSHLLFAYIVNNIPVSALRVDCLCVQTVQCFILLKCIRQLHTVCNSNKVQRFLFIMIMIAL